jgi:biotin operon repressor
MNERNRTNPTLNELVDFLESQPGSRPKVISEALGVSRQYVQKLLSKHNDLFTVSGTGPNRFYRLKEERLYDEKNKAKHYWISLMNCI